MEDFVRQTDIPELRKETAQGKLCVRRPATIDQIHRAKSAGYQDLVDRAAITDRSSPDYVVSEVLIFMMRETKQNNNRRLFDELYGLLWQRILSSFSWQRAGNARTEDADRMEMEDRVIGNLNELIASDQEGYDEDLDYYEVSFDQALKYDRLDAWRAVMGKANRTVPMTTVEDPERVRTEVGAALNKLAVGAFIGNEEKIYRKRILAAIRQLPDKERDVMLLTLRGFSAETNDPEKLSISSVLGIEPRTVRNRRKAAVAKLRRLVGEDR